MKGYKIKEGYLIVIPSEKGERTVEAHTPFYGDMIKDLRKEDKFKGDLGSFVEKAVLARVNGTKLELSRGESNKLHPHVLPDEIQRDGLYWKVAKAIVAQEGPGKYVLANTTRNLFVRDDNKLVLEGIVDDFDVIALNHYDTFHDALTGQQNIEKLMNQIGIFEHHGEYEDNDFSNLPKNSD